MESMTSLRQKNTIDEYMILSGADNRPPMLDKDLYDSWKSRIKLYMQNKEHGRMILESVEHGPLIWPTIEEHGVIRTKKYAKLSVAEKIQADCDMKETNIIIQGLPSNIYPLVNHHRVAKDLWEIIQLLMQSTSLTKQERECKLYDAFDKFAHIKAVASSSATSSRRQRQSYSGTGYKSNATSYGGNNASGQARVIKCYNCQGEGHMANNALSRSEQEMQHENLALKEKVNSLEQNLSKQIKENECLLQTFTAFKRESKEKEAKNNENEIDLEKKIKELDNIIFKVGQSDHTVHMLTKPQESHKELPKVSLVNESLKKLKLHLANFNKVVKIRTASNARTEDEWGFEHTKAVFNNEIIPFLKSFKDIFNVFDRDLLNEIMELHNKDNTICKLKDIIKLVKETSKDKNVNYDYVEIETKNVKLENSVAKLILENERLCNEINHVKQVFKEQFDSIKRTSVRTKEQSDSLIDKLNLKSAKNKDLQAQIQDKSQLNANSELICATCKKSMFDGVHDRITFTNVVPPKTTTSHAVESQKPELKVYSRKLKNVKNIGSSKKAKIVKSKNANHSEPNHNWGSNATNIPSSSSLVMTVRFGNDHFARIIGYGDYQLGDVTISRVYYIEGLRHNLFSVGKSKKSSHQPKDADTNQEKLYLLHIDLCGSMRVASIHGKRYVLVIVDDYSRFTCVRFLRSEDEAPEAIIKCIKNIYVRLNATVCKLDAKADIGIFVGYAPAKKALRIYNKRTRKIIETIHDSFQTLFLNNLVFHQTEVIGITCFNLCSMNTLILQVFSPVPVAAAPRAVDLADSPLSTSIDQDALSTSIPSTQEQEHSPSIFQDCEESPKTPTLHDDPLNESPHEDYTSQESSSNVLQIHTLFEYLSKWTKDRPIANMIGDPSRFVFTRKQL
nr:integrase, catalytic region, zinc finger, CCHC-type, peptidase aspartic, catalytic [Tanacetum cinerariifolium]